MEVHHHPDLHHKKKHLKEYFLEFLLIFLAVSMGFVAENLREERIEHNKAKEFAISLIKDLENDNNNLKITNKLRVWREKKLDSLSNMLSKPLIPLEYNNLYYFSQFLFNRLAFPSNDATFQGMKSSGSMRYYKSLKLQSQIYGYYVLNSYLKDDNSNREKIETEAYKITSQILKQEYFSEIIDMGNDSIAYGTETKRLNHPTTLLSDDPLLINQLSSLAFLERKRSQMFVGVNQQLHTFQCKIGMNNIFLMYALSFQIKFMYKNASTTTVAYMNKTLCNSIPVIRPAIELQNHFAQIVEKTEALKTQYQQSLLELENLYGSLSQKAFKGELSFKDEKLMMAAEPEERYNQNNS